MQTFKNKINRRFNTSVPHQKITTDTTEFKIYPIDKNGKLSIKKAYLNPFLDMFNGEILSDQGWAYQMKQYTNTLKNNKIFQSMSRKGTCLDNSLMENFFGIMKQDRSFEELEKEVINYIYYYNNDRIKEKLKWNSPVNYRINYKSIIAQ